MDAIKIGFIRLKGDSVIWIIIFLLSMVSVLAVYSSSNSLAYVEGRNTMDYLFRQVRHIAIGLAFLFAFYNIPLAYIRSLSFIALPVATFLLIYAIKSGVSYNSADRWISIIGITFHTGEIAKVAVVMYLARIMELIELDTFKKFAICVILPLSVVLPLVLHGSISMGVFIMIISLSMFFIAGIKWNILLKTALLGVAGITLLVILNMWIGMLPRLDTAVNRVKNFATEKVSVEELTPQERQKIYDRNYQAKMAKVAISSVGILGKGPGKSTQRNFIPHPYSDFIYAIIIEEYGLLLGGIGVLMLYIWFYARAVMIMRKCKVKFSFLLVAGLSNLIVLQALLHICVNVGILPVTGHTLPMISQGGSSLVVLGAAFGMILSVSRSVEGDQYSTQIEMPADSDNKEEE